MAFSALGIDVHYTKDDAQTVKILHSLAKNDTAIIYITENAALNILDEIDKYKDSKLPAIILIPGAGENPGIGMAAIKKSVERAVGADILFND